MMGTSKSLVLAVAVLGFAAATAHAQRCGEQGDGMECPNNLCCSQHGYCSMGGDYCGNGCQNGACYTSKRCGTQASAAVCPNNHCCSQYGHCGFGEEYCGAGSSAATRPAASSAPTTSAAASGVTAASAPSSAATAAQSGACSSNKPCGKDAGGKVCTNNYCCSQWGNCGIGPGYCGAGCQSGGCYTSFAAALAAGFNFTLLFKE